MATALTDVNLYDYIKEQNPDLAGQVIKCKRKLYIPIESFLQRDYGDDNDCTITSIATSLYYLCNKKYKMVREFADIYTVVEKHAKAYGYRGDCGTLPFFNKVIYESSAEELGLVDFKTEVKYLKNIGFKYDNILEKIRKGIPMTLSLWKDGRGYYSNHTVNLVGFNIMQIGEKEIPFLTVYDNWSKVKSYIDYSKLSTICCINYPSI